MKEGQMYIHTDVLIERYTDRHMVVQSENTVPHHIIRWGIKKHIEMESHFCLR